MGRNLKGRGGLLQRLRAGFFGYGPASPRGRELLLGAGRRQPVNRVDGKGIVQLSADGRVATTIDNTNSALTSNSVIGACRNADGSFYLATYGGGIVRFDGGRLSRPRWGMLPSVRYPHKMAYDAHGNLWIGSVKAGLTRIDASGRATVYTYSNSGLNTNTVTDVVSDRSGRVFVVTGTGLAYISDSGGRRLPLRLPSVFLRRWRRQALICQIFALLRPWGRHHSRHLRPDSKDRPAFGKTVERRPHGNRHRRGR